MIPCPDENALVGYIHKLLDDRGTSSIERHVRGCTSCASVIAALLRVSDAAAEEPASAPMPGAPSGPLPAGSRVGRYVVSAHLGSSPTGDAYAARDPEGEGRVLLRLFHTLPGEEAAARAAREHLLREAEALSRQEHPHLAAISGFGEAEGHVFLASPLAEDAALSGWLREHPGATWRELRALLLKAGRGLAAAHAAGLAHRNFTPNAVRITPDGQVRVAEFALAEPPDFGALSFPSTPVLFDSGPHDRRLFAAAPEETPSYLAPEQLLGQPADSRSDQFSFCVVLYEALHGERPFRAPTLAETLMQIREERVRPPPPGCRVPPRLRKTLLRGLRADPSSRFPSMAALLRELERDTLAARVASLWQR